MKIYSNIIFAAFALLPAGKIMAQGTAINTSGSAAAASAMLDVSSTTQGMLTPRMTAAQKTAISSPATGLLIYQTDGTAGFYYYSGSAWAMLSSGSSGTSLPTGASPAGIPYTVMNRGTTNVGTSAFCPVSNSSALVASASTPQSVMTLTDCHPTLTAWGGGSSSNFPLTVSLVQINYSTSATAITLGSTIGSCTISAAGGTCAIDVAGYTLSAGSGITIKATSSVSPILLNTAFSCY